jgi:beta-ribofuranosylaminobenzene 5'-phosphate synthase
MDEGRSNSAEAGARALPRSAGVSVMTTARLHFGFLDPSGRGAQPFGSFGLAIDRPMTRLTLRRANSLKVSGEEAERATHYLAQLAEAYDLRNSYALTVDEAIPPHSGLGSGTQLALAVGTALSTLEGLSASPQDIAIRLGRGARSGIGIATFAEGGVVLDGGPTSGALPELIARVPFPDDWRVLLIFDPYLAGIHGGAEAAAFEQTSDFPQSEVEQLRTGILNRALPAIEARDFDGFTAEVGALQTRMGTYFASLQGGPIVSSGVAKVLDWVATQGLKGIGQSSWGPTGFVFVRSESEGASLLENLQSLGGGAGLRFQLVRGRNQGAEISVY